MIKKLQDKFRKKLIKAGFKPKYKVEDAIRELSKLYKSKILFAQKNSYSLKYLKSLLRKKKK